MGLTDKLKKKSKDAEKPEEIGGIIADTKLTERPISPTKGDVALPDIPPAPLPQGLPQAPPEALKEPPKEKKTGGLSAMDIFAAETAESDEGNQLAKQLHEVDINDLLTECKEIAAKLRQPIT
ncbi:MAG: hypothetical protein PHV74_03315 [Dehalococcoidia bacterium]|nr:hypothetical protein [Dehalococcoidia bacterium]